MIFTIYDITIIFRYASISICHSLFCNNILDNNFVSFFCVLLLCPSFVSFFCVILLCPSFVSFFCVILLCNNFVSFYHINIHIFTWRPNTIKCGQMYIISLSFFFSFSLTVSLYLSMYLSICCYILPCLPDI